MSFNTIIETTQTTQTTESNNANGMAPVYDPPTQPEEPQYETDMTGTVGVSPVGASVNSSSSTSFLGNVSDSVGSVVDVASTAVKNATDSVGLTTKAQ
jgi:hypothetical protein